MKQDFLKGLGLSDELITQIQVESGKDVQKEKDKYSTLTTDLATANATITTYETKLKAFEGVDVDKLQGEIKTLQDSIAANEIAAKQAKAEELLTNNISELLKDKQFVNDYTKSSIISSIKTEIEKPENKGKGISEVFDTLTKDVEGIFKSANPPANIPPTGNIPGTSFTHEQLSQMSVEDINKNWDSIKNN